MNLIDSAYWCGFQDRQQGRPFEPHYLQGTGYQCRRHDLDSEQQPDLYQAYARGWHSSQHKKLA